jgi:signal peptidase I
LDWELIAWGVMLTCAAIIAWSLVANMRSGEMPSGPPLAWLEIAYPVLFIATMGALLRFMSFAAVLLTATVVTGVIWFIDSVMLRKKRGEQKSEPILVELAKSFFPVILVVFLLRSFLIEPFKIPSGSMLPSLLVGDFILVNKYTFGVRIPVLNKKIIDVNQPKRGEVMVFRYPEDPSKDFIKRIVGLPGDTVAYQNKRLTLNGVAVPVESAGSVTEIDERMSFQRFDTYREKLGDSTHVIIVSPDRPVLAGGVRQFPNKKNCEYNDEGVTCKIPEGHYFMMGDNRDNSDDSRYWGFVPEENIVGKAFLVWMNFGHLKRIGTSID